MKLVIVPNELKDAINRKLDEAMLDCPGAECERQNLYELALGFFDEHGYVPDISIAPVAAAERGTA